VLPLQEKLLIMSEPRIYTYKITFKGSNFFYFGIHKEKFFDEEYWGSPVTHKHLWDVYGLEKEILSCFSSWGEAKKAERELILPFLNDSLCLNENAGGMYSLSAMAKGGQIVGRMCKEQKKGFFAMSSEEWSEAGRKGGRKGGKRCYEEGKGLFGRPPEKIKQDCSRGGKIGGPIGGRKSKPSKESRLKLAQTARETRRKYPHILEKFLKAGDEARKKPIRVINLSTDEREEFPSISAACKEKNLTASAITGVLQGKFNHHKGYFFELL